MNDVIKETEKENTCSQGEYQMDETAIESLMEETEENGGNKHHENLNTIFIQEKEGIIEIKENSKEPEEDNSFVKSLDTSQKKKIDKECSKKIKIISDKSIKYIPLKVSFENVLKFKSPKDIPETLKNRKSEKAPKAIDSQVWRNFQQQTENEKTQKMQSIKRRKEERAKAKKKKTVNKKEEKAVAKLPKSKEVISCAACEEELHSDTDEEENKNIGCDSCSKWFHLRCTEFFGMPFEEAANKDYNCFTCS